MPKVISLTGLDVSDDLTVQVIFFGHGEKTGEVKENPDATADDAPKPKL